MAMVSTSTRAADAAPIGPGRRVGRSGRAFGAFRIGAALLVLGVFSAAALAGPAEEALYGTWRLVSSQRRILDTGELEDSFGAHPSGYITYGRDGRMSAILVREDRPKAASIAAMSDAQRAGLFRTMVAYAGTWRFDGRTMEHHIDISWNELWTGTTQVRDVRKDGERLIYTTRPAPAPGDGRMSVSTVVWEKVK
jgi:hypothetical protein